MTLKTSFCIDLGGSTIDMVEFSVSQKSEKTFSYHSLESKDFPKKNLSEILHAFGKTEEIKTQKILCVTGGHSALLPNTFFLENAEIQIQKISEFEAIAKGGCALSGENSGLVISLGTGTAMVSVSDISDQKWEHVRGTGIGGGTFLGLGKALLGLKKFSEIQEISQQGILENVDISVGEILGEFSGKMGGLTPEMTASNFGKFSPEISEKSDIALGIANLVGQSIASLAVEKAKRYGHTKIILGGKFSRLRVVVECIKKTAEVFGMEIIVPENSGFMTAVGGVV